MNSNCVKNNVYYVGIKDKNLKTFDVTMKLENGTSYNSYLVKDIKNVLIDTVKEEFFREYIIKINSILPVEKIDYLVLNHTEPDHAGSVGKLLELNPKIKVIATTAGANNIKEIINKDIEVRIIKDISELKIGSNTLTFIPAPLLHWPDTMFTKIEKENLLCTGDFLGAHYTEEDALKDVELKDFDKYMENVNKYYYAIMSPFSEYVLKGVEIVRKFYPDMILPSHGPILTAKKENILSKYKFNALNKKETVKVPIIYASAYGYTKMLAEEIEKQVDLNKDLHAELYNIEEYDVDTLVDEIYKSKLFFIGTPTINKDCPTKIKKVISSLDAITLRKKKAGVFGSYGWSGEAIKNTITRLKLLGIKVEEEGFKVKFKPTKENLEEVKNFALKVIE